MRRSAPALSLLALLALLATGCARPGPTEAAAAMEEALASHRASLAAIPGAAPDGAAPGAAVPGAAARGAAATGAARAGGAAQGGAATGSAATGGVAPGSAVPGGAAAGRPQGAGVAAASNAAPVLGPAPTMAGQLVGQPPETLRHWLGEPRLRRDEGSAQVWHYQSADCHLDVILYREEGGSPGWRVAFAQARAIGTARRAEASCLREIARGTQRRLPDPPARLAGAAA